MRPDRPFKGFDGPFKGFDGPLKDSLDGPLKDSLDGSLRSPWKEPDGTRRFSVKDPMARHILPDS